MPAISAAEATAVAVQEQRVMNASRFIPETPDMYRRAAQANRLYIFNVGPWAHLRELGSAGSFRIPACPADREYSDPVVVNGVVEEPYPITEVECKQILTEGAALAGQIIGEGPFIAKASSFVPYGVFLSPTPVPSREALATANAALQRQHAKHIREADEAYMRDPANKLGVIQDAWHLVSAHALKKSPAECRWMGQSVAPAERSNCPGCGEVYNVGILRHSCGWFFDRAKWEANQAGSNSSKSGK